MTRISLVLGAVALCLSISAAGACTKPADASAAGAGMIEWINQQRQANGLRPLSPSGKLAAAAQGHACDMAERGYFDHQRPGGGPKLGERARASGYRFGRIAENIAWTGSTNVAGAAQVWRKSPGHWANILKPDVADIGMSLAQKGGRVYWVMNVGRLR